MIATAKFPSASTVVSANSRGVENNHTCTGVDAINELVAISSGTDDDVANPAEEILENPARAILDGPDETSTTPSLDF